MSWNCVRADVARNENSKTFLKKSRNTFWISNACWNQGCQMVCFQTKNPNLGKFWRVLQWKIMVFFMDTWSIFTAFCYILWTFGIVRGNLVYYFPFWYFVPRKIWQPWLELIFLNFKRSNSFAGRHHWQLFLILKRIQNYKCSTRTLIYTDWCLCTFCFPDILSRHLSWYVLRASSF
jgi:hypothetical protein